MKIFVFGGGFVSSVILSDERILKEEIFIVNRKTKEIIKEKNITYLPYEKSFEIINQIKPDVILNTVGILKGRYIDYYNANVKHIERVIKTINEKTYIVHISAWDVESNKGYYNKTKLEGEKIIINSNNPYFILRPGIIWCKGQRLFDDFRRLKYLPFIFAPKGKVAICECDVLKKKVVDVIYKKETGIYEIYSYIKTYKEMFSDAFKFIGYEKIIIEVPKFFFLLVAFLGECFSFIPFNLSLYHNIKNK